MIKSKGYAGFDSKTALKPYHFERRELGDLDVLIKIKYCGVCHSDIHTVRNEWGGARYPLVPGHEIIGIVERVGQHVTQYHIGDTVGVGCMINSCGHCHACTVQLEQFCSQGPILTYNSLEANGTTTKGGYSDNIVVNEQFVLSVPAHLNLAETAPLLCAGITTYSPLMHWGIKPGDKVGIIGLGGLGHMAVKFAHALGAQVVVFTTSEQKMADALSLGAYDVVLSRRKEEMLKHRNSFDFILDTVSAPHDINAYMTLLKHEKTLCMLGISPTPHHISSSSLFMGRKNLSGSLIGGIAETQEMLNFCGQNQITCTIELISIQDINEAYTRILNSDVKYRFVIDMESLNQMP